MIAPSAFDDRESYQTNVAPIQIQRLEYWELVADPVTLVRRCRSDL